MRLFDSGGGRFGAAGGSSVVYVRPEDRPSCNGGGFAGVRRWQGNWEVQFEWRNMNVQTCAAQNKVIASKKFKPV